MWRTLRGYRSAEFARRSALYARIDTQLAHRTRFFAAAALINTVFARLFGVLSAGRAPRSFRFLEEVGATLEVNNLNYARAFVTSTLGGSLDRVLVCAEQSQLQRYVREHEVQNPHQWQFVRCELNDLLNVGHLAAFSQWCHASRNVTRVLREVRGDMGRELDFAMESDRVRIGISLIEHIRKEAAIP